jgi:RNA-directed DNA polymerase
MPAAHPNALGFVRGRSAIDHARRHGGRAVVLRMDLEDFFGSTTEGRARRFFRETWDDEAAGLLVALTTHRARLPQGAPTSPILSNVINNRMDSRLAGFAARRGVTYSRYADDITFSLDSDGVRLVRELIRFTKRVVTDDGYRLHERRKLHVRRRHQRQLVSGLVVNDWPRLPRERRRWLRAVEHHVASGQPMTLTAEQLAGWRAYRSMVDARAREDGSQAS